MITLSVILGVLLLGVGATVIYGVSQSGGAPSAPADVPTLNPSEARPGVDIGAGTPGAPCSTDRLGKFFVKDGVTYTCGGPKPYHWLPPG